MAAPSAYLLSRNDFFSEDFVLANCGICVKPFDVDHQPLARDCDLEYGLPKCPLGKQWLFFKLDKAGFFEGARQVPLANEDFKLAQHPDAWIEAKTFIKLIRKALYGLYKREQTTYDSDIEQGVNFGWVPMA
ncbi:hypothetical protein AA0118_g4800 [Alternaria tenuissima]|nr:hypothetical protein AALT_g4579 [Alternaria alternata]RYN63274.1 hypothetical protein AA0118_g4800 [Alternaria tenuissima]RYN96083.1 hypothetical protein AA0120_g2862 [Alternaria tenuissima]